jgi:DNA mismatch endonuclease (patch repair protein)
MKQARQPKLMQPLPPLKPRASREALTRSQMMSRIRSKDTLPETRVRSAAHKLGMRFRNHAADLPGTPDLINRRKRWVIFVHGCFWHGHPGCALASKPRSNAAYWAPKLRGNIARDLAHCRELEHLGFRVYIIWECETRRPERLMDAVSAVRDSILRKPLDVQASPSDVPASRGSRALLTLMP